METSFNQIILTTCLFTKINVLHQKKLCEWQSHYLLVAFVIRNCVEFFKWIAKKIHLNISISRLLLFSDFSKQWEIVKIFPLNKMVDEYITWKIRSALLCPTKSIYVENFLTDAGNICISPSIFHYLKFIFLIHFGLIQKLKIMKIKQKKKSDLYLRFPNIIRE